MYNLHSGWEFQKRSWLKYGPSQIPYHKTNIVYVQFLWNNIRFSFIDHNWEQHFDDRHPNDFSHEDWKQNFIGTNEFFTKFGPYANPNFISSMVIQTNPKY